MRMVCGRCVGVVYLAPGVLQGRQATVLALWQLRGEFKRPRVRLGGGPAGGQASSITVYMHLEQPGVGPSLMPEKSVPCRTSHSEITGGPAPIARPVAPPQASLSFTSHQSPALHLPIQLESLSFSAAISCC